MTRIIERLRELQADRPAGADALTDSDEPLPHAEPSPLDIPPLPADDPAADLLERSGRRPEPPA